MKIAEISFVPKKAWLSDLRFWILLFFLIRLLGITNAPLELGHNWRQCLTSMISRNLLEDNFNFLFPRIDMAGEKTGIIGSEFPIFNALMALLSSLFSEAYWQGRLLNLVVSSFGVYYFYRLLCHFVSEKIAWFSAFVLLISFWFGFSRKIMPDSFSTSLVIMGLFHAFQFLKTTKNSNLLWFFLLATLGVLSKIPALFWYSLLLLAFFQPNRSNRLILKLLITSFLSFLVVCLWYFYWVPYLVKTYEFQLFFTKGIVEGFNEITPLWKDYLEKFYFSAFHSYAALACFMAGTFYFFKEKNRPLQVGIAACWVVFILFTLKTGAVFPQHSYYIVPFVPIMALFCGFFLAKIPAKISAFLILVICGESIANQQHHFFVKDQFTYKLSLETIAQKHVQKGELIIINGGDSPQDIYFSNCKGWTTTDQNLVRPEYIDSIVNKGADYLIIDKSHNVENFDRFTAIFSNENYAIYSLVTE